MGAIGESHDAQYAHLCPNQMSWNAEMPPMPGNTNTYPGMPALYPSLSTPQYGNMDISNSPELVPPNSPSHYPPTNENGYNRTSSTSSSGSRDDPEHELRYLRKKVKDLRKALIEARSAASSGITLPVNGDPAFRSGWKRRTDARKKLFCSLNRAGNALCAWHDSRRERRQYPPRNAPEGMLNCGCTHEEALFEESLARHGVGGYFPGESVRMDPELRRPLLRLLRKRYGYQDGDFEHDPQTMKWFPEQDPDNWERQANSCANGRTRKSEHVDRH